MEFRFNSIEEAIEDIKQGKMVIVVDDPNRENEGDLVMAAEKVTPDAINFMAKEGRGLICLSMLRERLEELDIPLMTQNNTDPNGTAFCLSIDAHPKYGTTTGISAYDRAVTIKLAVSPDATPQDFVRPGHVFPLMARPGGVLERTGHTEASVDLARLAGLYPAGVICEIMKEDGTMARLPDLIKFAKKYDLKIITIADLVQYRLKREKFVVREAEAHLPTKYGTFKIYGYKNTLDGSEHVALVMGDIDPDKPTLVRVHSECLTGDIFGSLRCDCQSQLHAALKTIASEGKGVLVYMRGHEGRGIGIINKIKAYRLQEEGYDTVEANHRLGFNADLRDFGTGAQILLDIGVRKMKLMTNNPRKIVALEGFGLEVVERIPLIIEPNPYNKNYLKAKKEHLGHIFEDLKGESCSIDLDQLKEEMDSKNS
ncbi:MAG TPA: bifunctional 3,4-dihydroxy-2-butanone-4-phosphate synthase/GTP cyclohydrolase II [Persephonella sp.]|uniref:Riboflavin biosynthesis protein RibBA n=1 Tax=Persephonella marina (strain DSM 14350 / EX-H1) TaxID=123214 RepID=C0QRP0_PERMH|nr:MULTISPECIES: bifunctional 3,4-dihydroxy-2-butanone-4-phosphate synthase/GTP cyclohydrolase II [Persephonella]ACO04714.1 riboflavin biosynthesis protein ribBA [Persephonella marina EX-H1]HCB69081.1 bifunctional 3,4-dihydroxy-2-butanone-4-phosphate synthase/GTP cyclohydrolase II [Persephonella sp.]